MKPKKRIFTLEAFCIAVNNLAQVDANKSSFVHHDYPSRMLERYYSQGLSPRATVTAINQEAIDENNVEARVS